MIRRWYLVHCVIDEDCLMSNTRKEMKRTTEETVARINESD